MAYSVFIPMAIASLNIDAWNRNAVSAAAVENGNILKLTTRSATAGQGEVFTAVAPSTSDGLTDLWIAYEPEIVTTVSGSSSYRGIDPDPRNFIIAAGEVFSCFKPQLGDIYRVSADWFSGAKGESDTHANATNSTGGMFPVWGTSQTGSVFSVKLLATSYISLATGAINNQRITSYDVEVVGL